MTSIDSAACKATIVEYLKNRRQELDAEFDAPLTDEEFQATLTEKNWKRISKQIFDVNPKRYERIFDCRPFDDQLRAYVYTDENDTNITSIYVTGE